MSRLLVYRVTRAVERGSEQRVVQLNTKSQAMAYRAQDLWSAAGYKAKLEEIEVADEKEMYAELRNYVIGETMT